MRNKASVIGFNVHLSGFNALSKRIIFNLWRLFFLISFPSAFYAHISCSMLPTTKVLSGDVRVPALYYVIMPIWPRINVTVWQLHAFCNISPHRNLVAIKRSFVSTIGWMFKRISLLFTQTDYPISSDL